MKKRKRVFRYFAISLRNPEDSYQCKMDVSAETSEEEALAMAGVRNPKFEVQSDGFQLT